MKSRATARSPIGRARSLDGGVAASGPPARHSAFRPRLPIYVGGVPTILGSAPRHVQHERGGELRRRRWSAKRL
jgi:hypothetical protein